MPQNSGILRSLRRGTLLALAAGLLCTPSLARQLQLKYHSDLERDLLETWRAQHQLSTDLPRAILIAEGADSTALERYQQKLRALSEASGRKIKPRHAPERKAKALFKFLHREILRKYTEDTTLRRTLDASEYNCVSATTLLYIWGRRHGIPLELRLTPTHVYAVVKAEGRDIRIETTVPKEGYDFDQELNATIELLLEHKFITEEELEEKGPAQVYHEYVEASEVIEPAHLLAVTYNNIAAMHFEAEDPLSAFYTYEKAIVVDPARQSYKDGYQLALFLLSLEYANAPDEFYPLVHRALAFIPDDESLLEAAMDYLRAEATYYSREQKDFERAKKVIENAYALYGGDKAKIEALRALEDELDFDWAWSLAGTGFHEAAYERIRTVYRRRPDSPKVEESFLRITAQHALQIAQRGEGERALSLADSLLQALPQYPITKDLFTELTRLAVMHRNLLRDEPEEARDLLLRAHQVDPMNVLIRRMLAGAYYEMGMANIREKAYQTAREMVERGLEYDPDNTRLKETIEQIDELIH